MKLENLSWNEIDKEKSVIFIGLAPIEEHGKHLPICVDYYMTQRWIESAADSLNLSDKEHNYYTLPVIPLGSADSKTFPGNIHLKQNAIYRITKEVLENIATWGIQNIIVISAHADPKHQIAIEQACDCINKRYETICFSPMGAIFSQEKAGIDLNHSKEIKDMLKDYPNDYHAGWIETSMMMYYDKDMVKKEYIDAEDVIIKERDMISIRKINEALSDIGHLGYPRLASYELGKKLHINMVENIVKAADKFISRTDYQKYMHHFLYKIPFLRVGLIRR